MEMDIRTGESKEVILSDGDKFSYTIKQVEITNILGVAVAVLDEYVISISTGETCKLYKTHDGNWYDIADVNNGVDKGMLLRLKFGIDK